MSHENALPTEELKQTDAELVHQLIALRAYDIYEARGCAHGFDEQDWLQAEGEILGADSEPEKVAAASG